MIVNDDAKPGDYLTNGNFTEVWTCPACYTDHHSRVTKCDGCGAMIECKIEQQPVPVCTIIEMAP